MDPKVGFIGWWTPDLGSVGGGDPKVGEHWGVKTPMLGVVGGGDPKVGVGWVMKTPKFGFFGDGPRSWGWRPQR